jgi:hypothetical protein
VLCFTIKNYTVENNRIRTVRTYLCSEWGKAVPVLQGTRTQRTAAARTVSTERYSIVRYGIVQYSTGQYCTVK